MSARQEDGVDIIVQADFTRYRLVKSTILLHQQLFLVICNKMSFWLGFRRHSFDCHRNLRDSHTDCDQTFHQDANWPGRVDSIKH